MTTIAEIPEGNWYILPVSLIAETESEKALECRREKTNAEFAWIPELGVTAMVNPDWSVEPLFVTPRDLEARKDEEG